MSATIMAKRKTGKIPAPKPRTIGVRASGEWAEWVERAAKHDRASIAGFLDRAAAFYARSIGFTEPPPERGTD